MKLIPRYFMLLFAILLTACMPIQPPAAAPAGGAATPGLMAELTGEFELVQLLVDFPAVTWTPSHTHGGELLVTVSALALPKGAKLSTTKAGVSTDNAPPGPKTLYQQRLAGISK